MEVKIDPVGEEEKPTPRPETFTYTTERGFTLECGKPLGPLKMKLRDILSLDEINKDPELQRIATAFMCIRSVNGDRPRISNRIQFESFMDSRFGSDNDLNGFMNEYQKFSDPEMADFIEQALKDAMEDGAGTDEEITEFIKKRMVERAQISRDKVRL